MCHGEVQFENYESVFSIDFNDHFALELGNLQQQEKDGLLVMSEEGFRATPEGRLLLRSTAMAFDEYLQPTQSAPRFSRVI